MQERPTISRFTPSRTKPEILESILVQRHAMLEDAMERIEESVTTDNKHHLLFIGSRGCGKTHLISIIDYRLQIPPHDSEYRCKIAEFILRINPDVITEIAVPDLVCAGHNLAKRSGDRL